MTKFIGHTCPIERPRNAVLLGAIIERGKDGRPSVVEQLWTERVGVTEFRVCCIPLYSYDHAYNDVVSTASPSEWYIVRPVSRSGNGVLRVVVKDRYDNGAIDLLEQIVEAPGILHEWYQPGYLAINMEPDTEYPEFSRRVNELGDRVVAEAFYPLPI